MAYPTGSQRELNESIYRQSEENERKAAKLRKVAEKKKERRETVRFWLTFGAAALAALAGIADILLRLLER